MNAANKLIRDELGKDDKGFREIVQDKSGELIAMHMLRYRRFTIADHQIFRECWVCSKSGNLLRRVIDDVKAEIAAQGRRSRRIDTSRLIESIVRGRGFTTPKEAREMSKIQGKTIVAYRGCKGPQDFGYCWTLAKDIAEFFACRQNGQVVTAHVQAASWLNTAEHEVIVTTPDNVTVVKVEAPSKEWGGPGFWENRPTILPIQNIM
jgi:hypothetical protein